MARDKNISAVPVIILHGWGQRLSGRTFVPLKISLEKKGYTVFAPDLPGFGDQAPLDHAYTLDDYVAFLKEYFQKHRITMGILIGHSFGGRIGIKYAFLYPESVRSLILSGTPGFRSGNSLKYFISIGLAKVGKFIIQLFPFGFFYQSVRNIFYRFIGVRDYMRSNPVMRDTFRAIVAERLVTYMNKLTVPVLLLWGEHDLLVPVSVAQRMSRAIPHAKLEILTSGTHAVSYEQPDLFVTRADEFLRDL